MAKIPQPKGLKSARKISKQTVKSAGLPRQRIKKLGKGINEVKALSKGKIKKF